MAFPLLFFLQPSTLVKVSAVPPSSTEQANAALGLKLFFVYSAFYAGFVLVNALVPSAAEWMILPGLNLAIVWGFSLIALAFLFAMIYGFACRNESKHGPAKAVETSRDSSDKGVRS